MIDKINYTKNTLNLKGKLIGLETPKVMGIINLTPDSFFEKSRVASEATLLTRVQNMLVDGCDIIDLGACSTRPGALEISEEEERQRLIPAIKSIIGAFPDAYISVDTYRANIAFESVQEGACLINDISGGSYDPNMFDMVAKLNVPYVLMHIKGSPADMTKHAKYDDIFVEIIDYFQVKIPQLRKMGVKDIILDVGFGFAKTIDHNFELLAGLSQFNLLNLPILAGISRKSMIYKSLNISAEDALNGTSVLNMVALQNGASLLRVHDVKQAKETIKLFKILGNWN